MNYIVYILDDYNGVFASKIQHFLDTSDNEEIEKAKVIRITKDRDLAIKLLLSTAKDLGYSAHQENC